MHRKPTEITGKSTLLYGLRVLGAILTMEIMMHYFYVVSISKTHAWSGFTPFQISMIGYFNLKFIWLKVNILIIAAVVIVVVTLLYKYTHTLVINYLAILPFMGYG
jgi:Na+-transporting NADH:ubiquinone oxidoreductase subunit NqrD